MHAVHFNHTHTLRSQLPPRTVIYHLIYFFKQHITQHTVHGTFKIETLITCLRFDVCVQWLGQPAGVRSLPCSPGVEVRASDLAAGAFVSVAVFLIPRI